jgi:hypothetical protein
MASKYDLEMAAVDLEAVLYLLYVLGQRLAKIEEALGLPVGDEIMLGFAPKSEGEVVGVAPRNWSKPQ